MNIQYETLSGMVLFRDDILGSFILHIPHSSINIPDYTGFFLDKVEDNINYFTDWETDKIFNVGGIEKIVTPYSRLFCDVERFDDNLEPLVSVGRGFYYTHGYDGLELRMSDDILKKMVYENYYKKHHELFYKKVKEKVDEYGVCHIIDCHSFNEYRSAPSEEQMPSPDICIGTDLHHTPDYLLEYSTSYFNSRGYSTEINKPYSGCIIPKPYYMKNDNVKSIMIEINKRLYMPSNIINHSKVAQLQNVMDGFFNTLI